jgi:hypothetical protein
MTHDKNVVEFPVEVGVSAEERNRRVMVEATRLAGLSSGEWKLWLKSSAEQLGIPPSTLGDVVRTIITEQEKKDRESKAEARRQERRAETARREQEREQKREQDRLEKEAERKNREKDKAFAGCIKLPCEQHERMLVELAKRLDEDIAAIRDEFSDFCRAACSVTPEKDTIEPWPEPVEIGELLQSIVDAVSKFVVLRAEQLTAIALWVVMAWAHELAVHSPILAATSVEPDSGKSTLIGVLKFLVPKPFVSVEPSGPSVFRMVDYNHPTLIIDEADDLFHRKSNLRAIVNAGWSRGTKIPRIMKCETCWFDPFCPKILGVLGTTKLPRTVASRSIIIRMWPKRPDEKAEDFTFADDETFVNIRRKAVRWVADNASILKGSKPPLPLGLNNRLAANWRLIFAIAAQAGGGWSKRARQAATWLSRRPYEPSLGVRLLAAIKAMLAERREITSEEIVQGLLADPDSVWHESRGRGPITKHQTAALLREFEIRPVVLHPTKEATVSRRGYRAAQFEDAFARFVPSGRTSEHKPRK